MAKVVYLLHSCQFFKVFVKVYKHVKSKVQNYPILELNIWEMADICMLILKKGCPSQRVLGFDTLFMSHSYNMMK